MTDNGRISRLKPGQLGYAKPGSTEKVYEWQLGPGGSMKNYDEYMRPLRPGEKMNQREEEETPHYNKGGSVKKHGSSTCVHSRTKG